MKAGDQFTLFGTDLTELYAAAPNMESKTRGISDLQDVNSDLHASAEYRANLVKVLAKRAIARLVG